MALAEAVFRLEQVDAELESQEGRLRDLQRRRQRNPELESALTRVKALEGQEREANAALRACESDLADIEGKMKRTHERLYGGTVVDPRELASLERELEHSRTQRDGVEERYLEAMERLEGVQRDVRLARSDAEAMQHAWEEAKPGLAKQAADLAASIADLKARREPIAGKLDPQTLNLYDRLRHSLGHAVSPVNGDICGWCRVTIPPKDIQHARGAALVTCPNCRRILYAGR